MREPPLPVRARSPKKTRPPTLTSTLAQVPVQPASYLSRIEGFRRTGAGAPRPSRRPPQPGTASRAVLPICHVRPDVIGPADPLNAQPLWECHFRLVLRFSGEPGALYRYCLPCSFPPAFLLSSCVIHPGEVQFCFSNFFASFCSFPFCSLLPLLLLYFKLHHSSKLERPFRGITGLFL